MVILVVNSSTLRTVPVSPLPILLLNASQWSQHQHLLFSSTKLVLQNLYCHDPQCKICGVLVVFCLDSHQARAAETEAKVKTANRFTPLHFKFRFPALTCVAACCICFKLSRPHLWASAFDRLTSLSLSAVVIVSTFFTSRSCFSASLQIRAGRATRSLEYRADLDFRAHVWESESRTFANHFRH